MFSYSTVLLLLFTTIHADNFSNILKAIQGTSEGKSVFSTIPGQTVRTLLEYPQDAGEFICYLMNNNPTGAAIFVGTTITDEFLQDWTTLTGFCAALPKMVESDLDAIVNGANDAVDIVSSLIQDPTGVVAEATSLIASAYAAATSEAACIFSMCGTTAGVWQQLTSSCQSIRGTDPTQAVYEVVTTSDTAGPLTTSQWVLPSTTVAPSTSASADLETVTTWWTSGGMSVSGILVISATYELPSSTSTSESASSTPMVYATSTQAQITSTSTTAYATSTSVDMQTSASSDFSTMTTSMTSATSATSAATSASQQTQSVAPVNAGGLSKSIGVETGVLLALAVVGMGALCLL